MKTENPAITIIIAAHKPYRMPEDPMYLPLQVGAEGKTSIGYRRDDEGENISGMNPYFCELTGLYWAWKNLNTDFIGLAHYRRHFSLHPKNDPWEGVLKYEEIKSYLNNKKLFVPKKRNYYIETLYTHYAHTHYISQLDETRKIIAEKTLDYLPSFDKAVNRRWGYMFNMLIARKDLFSDYCAWLFEILFELRNRIGEQTEKELDSYQGRFYGRISEIIFNVWLDHAIKEGTIHEEEIMEIPFIYMETIDWKKKGMAFLKAKFSGKKYQGSF